MHSFVRLLWDLFVWYCSEIVSEVRVLKNKVIHSLIEMPNLLKHHRKSAGLRVTWQMFHAGNFVWWFSFCFVSETFICQTGKPYKMEVFQYFPSKTEIPLFFQWGSPLLKAGIHIKVAISNICTILNSPLIKCFGYIGIMCYRLLGFIRKFKEKLKHFVSLAVLCLVSHLWLTTYPLFRASFSRQMA